MRDLASYTGTGGQTKNNLTTTAQMGRRRIPQVPRPETKDHGKSRERQNMLAAFKTRHNERRFFHVFLQASMLYLNSALAAGG
jgi:hypothetical protein